MPPSPARLAAARDDRNLGSGIVRVQPVRLGRRGDEAGWRMAGLTSHYTFQDHGYGIKRLTTATFLAGIL